MSNRIKMEELHAIRCLLKKHWSNRRIARELGIHRETVARYKKLFQESDAAKPSGSAVGSGQAEISKPAISITGLDNPQDPKPAISITGSVVGSISNPSISTTGSEPMIGIPVHAHSPPGRRSLCEEYHRIIVAYLENELDAVRIFQDLVNEHDFIGSYSSVRRYIRRLSKKGELPCRRFETPPGEEVQVDFGSGPMIEVQPGRRKKTWVFRMVLGNSRSGYSEAVHRQTTDNFIRCLENAFRWFGGGPTRVVIDNLKAAVSKADWYDPQLNPKLISFAEYYGFVIWPTRPYSPQQKGKIESGIKYVKNNCLKGRTFTSLSQLNEYLRKWERNVANTRIHGTTKKQVKAMFEAERKFLGQLPAERFPDFEEGKRKVHRDGHVEVARSYYSVPPEYTSHELFVRWDSKLVKIYNLEFKLVGIHTRIKAGSFSTNESHISPYKISAVEKGEDYLVHKAEAIGLPCWQWARDTLRHRGITGLRTIQGVLALAKKHSPQIINEACRVARSNLAFHSSFVRRVCQQLEEKNPSEWLAEHEIIRPLDEYSNVVKMNTDSIQTKEKS